jgi:hypothetical protein
MEQKQSETTAFLKYGWATGKIGGRWFQDQSDAFSARLSANAAIRELRMTIYAFPCASGAECAESGTKTPENRGMTLKDWFAGQIIAAMLGSDPANSSQRDSNGQLCKMDPCKVANLTKGAYQVAEAMMQVRSPER